MVYLPTFSWFLNVGEYTSPMDPIDKGILRKAPSLLPRFAFFFAWIEGHPDDGINPANQLRLVVYLMIYKVLYLPGGAGHLAQHVQAKIVAISKTNCHYLPVFKQLHLQ